MIDQFKLELIDLTGKVIWQKEVFLKSSFNIENTAKGIYILRINNSISKKFIIK